MRARNLLLVMLLLLAIWAVPVQAQDPGGAEEMVLQADRLFAQGRFCQAAPRYRAVIGERPEVFPKYAESRAACLRRAAEATPEPDADP